jgi:outer membrane immunogenic protein
MKRIIGAILLSFVAAGHAIAADLPQAPPMQAPVAYVPVVQVYNWGGIYVGVNGGWGFGSTKWTLPVGVSGTVNNNGGVFGGTLGANFQADAFVFGIEGDFDWSAVNTGTTSNICAVTGTCQTGNNWLSTLRGRVGYAMDRVLVYGTAGGAFANVQTTFNGANSSKTQAGWTAGLGVEVAFADNWTAKAEYLFVNLGNGNVSCGTAPCLALNAGVPITGSVGLTESLVRGGINYKFRY